MDFEKWFTRFKKENFLVETDWGAKENGIELAPSITRVCSQGAYAAGYRAGMERAAEIARSVCATKDHYGCDVAIRKEMEETNEMDSSRRSNSTTSN